MRTRMYFAVPPPLAMGIGEAGEGYALRLVVRQDRKLDQYFHNTNDFTRAQPAEALRVVQQPRHHGRGRRRPVAGGTVAGGRRARTHRTRSRHSHGHGTRPPGAGAGCPSMPLLQDLLASAAVSTIDTFRAANAVVPRRARIPMWLALAVVGVAGAARARR
jgi:hypothetical protein